MTKFLSFALFCFCRIVTVESADKVSLSRLCASLTFPIDRASVPYTYATMDLHCPPGPADHYRVRSPSLSRARTLYGWLSRRGLPTALLPVRCQWLSDLLFLSRHRPAAAAVLISLRMFLPRHLHPSPDCLNRLRILTSALA
jgi:hypothetical protein